MTSLLLAAYGSCTENQDVIDTAVVNALGDTSHACTGIKLLDFKPFSPVNKRTEITYLEESSSKLKRVTKGMTSIIIKLCTHNQDRKSQEQARVSNILPNPLTTPHYNMHALSAFMTLPLPPWRACLRPTCPMHTRSSQIYHPAL